MKNLSLKKLSCLLMVLICAFTSISMVGFEASAAAIKPSKVVISSLKRENKNTVKLYWDRVSYAKGYQVYMKTNGGSYKKILTTTKRSLKKTGLKIGSSYYFKVRAYTKYKGKTYYGSFSNVSKIKMNSYVYLVDVMEPYAGGYYLDYKGTDSVYMGNKPYFNSFTLQNSMIGGTYAAFNFQGKFSKISFYYGGIDGCDEDMTAMFYNDGELIKTINRKEDSLPEYCLIDIRNVYQFKIQCSIDGQWNKAGFGSVKLYY